MLLIMLFLRTLIFFVAEFHSSYLRLLLLKKIKSVYIHASYILVHTYYDYEE